LIAKGPHRAIYLILVSFLLALPISPSFAANLRQVFLHTLTTNPDLSNAHANKRAAGYALRRAYAGHLPTLDIRVGAGPERSNNPTTRTTLGGGRGRTLFLREGRIVAAQPLYTGGRVSAEISQAHANFSGENHQMLATRERVALDTTLAYIDLLRYRRLYALARQNVSKHLSTLTKVRIRSRSGAGRRVDTELAISRLARARTRVIEIQRQAQAVQAKYKEVTGLAIPLRLRYPSFITSSQIPENLDTAGKFALKNNPALKANSNDVFAARKQIDIAKAAYFPQLNAEVIGEHNYDLDGLPGKNQALSAQLVVSYNIFNGGADQATVREARQKLAASQAERSSAQRQVLQELKTHWSALNASRAKIVRLSHYVRASRLVVKDYITQFTLGKRALFNVLDAETELFNAQTALTNAQFDMLTETSKILADMGILATTMLVSIK